MDYVFYFDESFHDRKITICENGTINTLKDDSIDNYIGAFWGCPKKSLRANIERIQQFEDKYRAVFGILDGKEFKSEVIGPKNYICGIRSFNRNTMSLYEAFFSMLDEMKPVIQIDAISKMEWALRTIFKHTVFPPYVNISSFFYSLTKFFVTYKPVDIIRTMYQVRDIDTLHNFQNSLVHGLKQLAIAEEGIQRKDTEIKAFLSLAYIIENLDIAAPFDQKFDFTYVPNFEGFCRLLQEKGIDSKNVKLVIDREQNTFKTAQHYRFKKICQANSANVIQIRLSDFISGFIGRMIRGLMHDTSFVEKQINDIDALDRDALVGKRLLRPDWFDLNEEKFNLYKLIYKVLILNCEFYWSTMTLSYCDEVSCFYSLLRYIASHENYSDFKKTSLQLHAEYYNSCCLDDLNRSYNKM